MFFSYKFKQTNPSLFLQTWLCPGCLARSWSYVSHFVPSGKYMHGNGGDRQLWLSLFRLKNTKMQVKKVFNMLVRWQNQLNWKDWHHTLLNTRTVACILSEIKLFNFMRYLDYSKMSVINKHFLINSIYFPWKSLLKIVSIQNLPFFSATKWLTFSNSIF